MGVANCRKVADHYRAISRGAATCFDVTAVAESTLGSALSAAAGCGGTPPPLSSAPAPEIGFVAVPIVGDLIRRRGLLTVLDVTYDGRAAAGSEVEYSFDPTPATVRDPRVVVSVDPTHPTLRLWVFAAAIDRIEYPFTVRDLASHFVQSTATDRATTRENLPLVADPIVVTLAYRKLGTYPGNVGIDEFIDYAFDVSCNYAIDELRFNVPSKGDSRELVPESDFTSPYAATYVVRLRRVFNADPDATVIIEPHFVGFAGGGAVVSHARSVTIRFDDAVF